METGKRDRINVIKAKEMHSYKEILNVSNHLNVVSTHSGFSRIRLLIIPVTFNILKTKAAN